MKLIEFLPHSLPHRARTFVYKVAGQEVVLDRPSVVAWFVQLLGCSDALIRRAEIADTQGFRVKRVFNVIRVGEDEASYWG